MPPTKAQDYKPSWLSHLASHSAAHGPTDGRLGIGLWFEPPESVTGILESGKAANGVMGTLQLFGNCRTAHQENRSVGSGRDAAWLSLEGKPVPASRGLDGRGVGICWESRD